MIFVTVKRLLFIQDKNEKSGSMEPLVVFSILDNAKGTRSSGP